jgi:uncharacterized protein (TIGR02118 family)
MIKLVFCVSKREDISSDEFFRYWLEDHGPLVKSVADDIGACRYVQSHTVLPELNEQLIAGRKLQQPYDGITEVWWNSMEDLEKGFASPEGIAASKRLQEDEATFIDLPKSRVFMTEEHEIF